MKKTVLILLLALPLSLFAQNAKIKIDIFREIGDIDPKIYGVFMEPIHFSGKMIGHSMGIYTIHPQSLQMRTASEKIM
jgi:alpha-N-arabinofuranosidase